MASKREGIILAFIAALAGTTQVSTRIYRSRAAALTREQAPALVVRWDQDQFTGAWVSNLQERALSIFLDVYTRGAEPDSLADPILVDAHARVMANATLRNLVIDVFPNDTAFEVAQADKDAGFTSQQYVVKYRHLGTALDSA
jgi:hypothetical protein